MTNPQQKADFIITDKKLFQSKLLAFSQSFTPCTILTSNDYYADKDLTKSPFYYAYDLMAGLGSVKILKANAGSAFQQLSEFHNELKDWLFGYFSYDLKNETEVLKSSHPDLIGLPDMYFFQPEIVLLLKDENLQIISNSDRRPEEIYEEIVSRPRSPLASEGNTSLRLPDSKRGDAGVAHTRRTRATAAIQRHTPNPSQEGNALPQIPPESKLKPRFRKKEYTDIVEKLRQHIIEGDVYEITFCQEFYNENIDFEPYAAFERLVNFAPNPFSCFLKIEDKYVLSASMERFIKKTGSKLISQPIKGTIKRDADELTDDKLKEELRNDPKERAENVMIVDLVRNDLAKSCKPGTVKVEELFGIYSFPKVHQMISTVTGEMRDNIEWWRAIKNAFPMGSMTGAPKVMAMALIEKYEKTRRGVYSGAVGYISPEGDFDFNVIIRTLVYNSLNSSLSVHAGGAITYDSVPEKEYEECLLKIQGLLGAMGMELG